MFHYVDVKYLTWLFIWGYILYIKKGNWLGEMLLPNNKQHQIQIKFKLTAEKKRPSMYIKRLYRYMVELNKEN